MGKNNRRNRLAKEPQESSSQPNPENLAEQFQDVTLDQPAAQGSLLPQQSRRQQQQQVATNEAKNAAQVPAAQVTNRGQGRGGESAQIFEQHASELPSQAVPRASQMDHNISSEPSPITAQVANRGRGRGRGRGTQPREPTEAVPRASQVFQDSQTKQLKPSIESVPQAPSSGARPKVFPTPDAASQSVSSSVSPSPKQAEVPLQSKEIVSMGTSLISNKKIDNRKMRPPNRPDEGGTKGRQIRLITNFVQMFSPNSIERAKKMTLYMYDAEFTPTLNEERRRAVITNMFKKDPERFGRNPPIHDGSRIIYSDMEFKEVTKQPGKKFIVDLQSERDDKKIEKIDVLLKAATYYNFSELFNFVSKKEQCPTDMPLEVIRGLDTIIKCALVYSGRYNLVGKVVFNKDHIEPLGRNNEWQYHQGLFVSVRPHMWHVRLNLDKTQTAFYPPKNLALMYDDYKKQNFRMRPNEVSNMFLKTIRQLRATANHFKKTGGGTYSRNLTIYSFSSQPATQLMIPDLKKSVAQYFLEEYKYRLQRPDLPCVNVKADKTRPTWTPMELLTLKPYQRPPGKNADITKEIIRKAAVPPMQRRTQIEQLLKDSNFNESGLLRRFCIDVDSKLLQVLGRVIRSPHIAYKDEKTVDPRGEGKWNADRGGYLMLDAPRDREYQWGLLSFDNKIRIGPEAKQYCVNLAQAARKMGVRLCQSPVNEFIADMSGCKPENVENIFKQIDPKQIDIMFVILSNGESYYEVVKRCGELKYGIPTQCVQPKNVSNRGGPPDQRTLENIVLKINAKLGGTNWKLFDKSLQTEISQSRLIRESVIVFGADVTHPSPTEDRAISKSLAAVVASVDRDAARYQAEISEQSKTKGPDSKEIIEVIVDLENMCYGLLKAHYQNTYIKPSRIIFYRDGVSEGQFQEVLEKEVVALQRACKRLGDESNSTYEPGITFVIVQKRHHTRFFPENPRDGVGKSGNVPAGTVVDRDIIHPREFNFYLCSHEGIQGTSKPTLYHVLWDDNGWGSDDLQHYTYFLCHLYAKCTRSVSVPAPVYYAHHAADRARTWRHSSESCSASLVSGGSGSGGSSVGVELKVAERIRKTMYFC